VRPLEALGEDGLGLGHAVAIGIAQQADPAGSGHGNENVAVGRRGEPAGMSHAGREGIPTEATEPLEPESLRLDAEALADGEVTARHLVQLLREGWIRLFEMLFARRCVLRAKLIRRFLYEPGGEALAVACRAVAIDKPVFASIFLLSRQAQPGDKQADPAELVRVL